MKLINNPRCVWHGVSYLQTQSIERLIIISIPQRGRARNSGINNPENTVRIWLLISGMGCGD